MNTVSKKSMLFAVTAGLVSLTACVGGGGGGSGSTPLAPRPTITASEITGGMPQQGYLAEDYSNTGDNGGLEASLKSGITYSTMSREDPSGASGEVITIKHGNSIDVDYNGQRIAEFKLGDKGDVELYGNGKPELLVGITELGDNGRKKLGLGTVGDSVPREFFVDEDEDPADAIFASGKFIGGQKQFLVMNLPKVGWVPLDHAHFGGWGAEYSLDVTLSNTAGESKPGGYYEIDYHPFYIGNDNNLKAPAANTVFTGKALAIATQYRANTLDNPDQAFFSGDAVLKIDASGKSGDLALNFQNFYKIGFDFTVNGHEFTSTKATIADNGYTGDKFRYPLNMNYDEKKGGYFKAHMDGEFYGASSSASEAAGKFGIWAKDTAHDDEFQIKGSFGVKQ